MPLTHWEDEVLELWEMVVHGIDPTLQSGHIVLTEVCES